MPKAPTVPRLPKFPELPTSGFGDLTALDLDGRSEGLLFDSDDGAGLDLEDTVFSECVFKRVVLQGAELQRASFGDCRFEELNAPSFQAAGSVWWNTSLVRTRIGSAELHGASIRSTLFEGGKLGYVNLRSAKLKDVVFRDVIIEELDLGSAQLERVSFPGCRIDSLIVNGAKLKHTDLRGITLRAVTGISGLRGATIDELQLADLAPVLAAEAGLLLG